MFNWLKRKVQLKAIQGAQEDIERFLKGLRGADIEAVAIIVATATHWRHVLFEQGIDALDPVEAERKNPALLMHLNRTIKEVQGKNPTMAAGLMVWLHTVRAANIPEIRAQGREMWSELARSFDQVEYQAETLAMMGIDLAAHDPAHVPIGFEPRR